MRENQNIMDYSKLRNEAQQRFGNILRDLCEASGFTQGKLAKEAKRERKRLIENGNINPGDLIGSMEQPAISRVLAGTQEPTYFQVLIWLQVLRKHYASDELAKKCEDLGIQKPEFLKETEQILWDLSAFRPPDKLASAYNESKKIQPIQFSIIDHRETRLYPKHEDHPHSSSQYQQFEGERETSVDLPASQKARQHSPSLE